MLWIKGINKWELVEAVIFLVAKLLICQRNKVLMVDLCTSKVENKWCNLFWTVYHLLVVFFFSKFYPEHNLRLKVIVC